MISIPKQLQQPEFRFIILLRADKHPLEKWKEKQYAFDDPILLKHLDLGYNYGVVGGPGNLLIIESDYSIIDEKFVGHDSLETFSVRSPGHFGLHRYYISNDKIENSKLKNEKYKDDTGTLTDLGQIQAEGRYVVGPGCIHTNGKPYDIVNDIDIKEITKPTIEYILGEFIDAPVATQKTLDGMKLVKSINITFDKVLKLEDYHQRGDEYNGSNPFHGSDSGANFSFNEVKGVWRCWRCETGGNVLHLIGIKEGIFKCHECKPGVGTKEQWRNIFGIAKRNYGLVEQEYKPSFDNTGPEMDILKNPNLLNIIIKECNKKIEGEVDSIRAIFLCSMGRLVRCSRKTSFNLFVSDFSGVGKDYVVDNALDIWQGCRKGYRLKKKIKNKDENGKDIIDIEYIDKTTPVKIKRTRISPKVLNYWHNTDNEEWSWDGMILYLEDISDEVLNDETFKVYTSGGSDVTVLKDQYVKDMKIIGKPVVFITSANASPDSELIRRLGILNLDSTKNQTSNIIRRALDDALMVKDIEYDEVVTNALTLLQEKSVNIPFARGLDVFSVESIIIRTFIGRFLDFIRASAVLHQFQREQDEYGNIIATG